MQDGMEQRMERPVGATHHTVIEAAQVRVINCSILTIHSKWTNTAQNHQAQIAMNNVLTVTEQ